jgi:MoaA/NifB/PqqE/SkfB family radical SAM enzyme
MSNYNEHLDKLAEFIAKLGRTVFYHEDVLFYVSKGRIYGLKPHETITPNSTVYVFKKLEKDFSKINYKYNGQQWVQC